MSRISRTAAPARPLPYQIVALDVDGTLVVPGQGCAGRAVQRAVRAVQALGAKVVIASGRCQFAAVDARVLGGIRPDYAVCAGGAQVTDAAGNALVGHTLTPEQMYALVDYCENYDHELAFSFKDHYYVYIGYEAVWRYYGKMAEHAEFLANGEDQNRHLQDMPYAAFCHMTPEHVAEFGRQYEHLGLRFIPFAPGWYDICQTGLTKASGLADLLNRLGLPASAVLAMGDGENDVELLRMAGLGVAMANAAPAAKAAADRIAPDVREDGAARLLDAVFGLGLDLPPPDGVGTERAPAAEGNLPAAPTRQTAPARGNEAAVAAQEDAP